ncbi:MAG: MMPL family transporter [Candidatus Limnocylindrales bacterium]
MPRLALHPGSRRRPGSTRPWTVRLALWSARHRWPVLCAWFVVTLGLFVASQSLGGIKAVSATSPSELSQTESGRASLAMQSGGAASLPDELEVVVTSASRKVTDPAFRTTVGTIVARLGAATTTLNGTPEPALSGLINPYAAPPTAGLLAADGTSVRIVGQIEGDAAALEAKTAALEPVIAALQAELPAYQIHAYGTTLINDEAAQEISRDTDGALQITLPATFLILLVAFGALVAACVPLLLAITALLGAFGLVGIFSQAIMPVSPYASQVTVLIGLAVAIDYSLFMITRFRAERRAGQDRLGAIEVASATSGRAVFFSGLAVMISLAGLFLVPVAVFQTMAVGMIAVIAVSVLGSLIFLPALLAILGDRVNRGAIPFLGRTRGQGGGAWARIVGTVMQQPIVAALTGVSVLLALASPVTQLHLGEADITALPNSVDAVQAVEALRAHWPAGSLLTLDVAVTHANAPATQAAIARLAPALLRVPGLSGPASLTASSDGTVTSVSVVMAGTANDPANWEIVRQVRAAVVPAVVRGLPGVAAYVGGDAAVSLDQTGVYTDAMGRIVLFVLSLSFLLLLLVFHSVVIPAKAIVLNLLATGAALGALVAVFQDGWFGGQLGIRPTEVTNFIPIFVFTTLFGLSMDYEVFILSRIKEAVDQGATSHEAVAQGIARSAGTVTSAAAIMVVVFAVFVTLPLGIARQLGLGLAVAVFVDATLVRTVLLPATMRLLGDWNWWMPPFLRWLPRVTIEGETGQPELARSLGGAGRAVESVQ